MKIIQSPLNFYGGKYKLLPQLLPLFPQQISTFVDVFCGGLNVSINVQAEKYIANDISIPLIDILSGMNKTRSNEGLVAIDSLIHEHSLSRYDKNSYFRFREYYNTGNKNWIVLYTLICHSFNYLLRFNSKGLYNAAHGTNRSDFNPVLRKKFVLFCDRLRTFDITFTSIDFKKLPYHALNSADFVYLDPPYLISNAPYNGSTKWTVDDDKELMLFCDNLHSRGIKFGMSNVLLHRGKVNHELLEWSKKYTVHHLNFNYNNCSYQLKGRDMDTDEVFICNYEVTSNE